MKRLPLVTALLLAATGLAAQNPPERLAFLQGCWDSGAPGFLTTFDFTQLRTDASGTTLTLGQRPYRLVWAAADSAVFEPVDGAAPRRLRFWRDGSQVAIRADSSEWRLSQATCPRQRPEVLTVAPRRDAPGSGATELMVFETLHGLFLGLAVPIVMEAEDPGPYGLGLILGGPTGLLLARSWARSHQPTTGQARAIVWGGTWGALSSLFLYQATEDFPSAEGSFGAMTAGLIGGTLFGGFVARNAISGGDATLAIHSTVWGGWFGLGLWAITQGTDSDGEAWAPMLIGGNAALLGASMASRRVEMSTGRVWLITATGLAGLVAGLGVDILAQPDDEAVAIGIPVATSFIGLAAGVSATRTFDRDRLAMGDGPGGPALLSIREGRARLALPLPQPALVPRDDGVRRTMVPGLTVRLFSMGGGY